MNNETSAEKNNDNNSNKSTSMFGIKTADTAIKMFNDLYEMERLDNPELTKGKFFELFVNRQSPAQVVDTEAADIVKQLTVMNDRYLQFIDDVCVTLGIDNTDDADAVVAEIKQTQQRAMMALESTALPPDALVLYKVPEMHRKLMNEVCKRLSVVANREVSVADVLLDMFIRYNVEQYNEWFYPFVVRPAELEDITGYSALRIKLWLKKQKSDE